MASTARSDPKRDTREEILDTALDLFVEKGYEATSLREIAGRLGISKAALYYHFASKGDILLALHLRMHDLFASEMLPSPGDRPTVRQWRQGLHHMGRTMLANRKLMALQVRDHQAIDEVQRTHDPEGRHHDAQARMEAATREFLTDPAIPLETRVRVAAGLGVVITMSMQLIEGADFSGEELEGPLDRILDDVLGPVDDSP